MVFRGGFKMTVGDGYIRRRGKAFCVIESIKDGNVVYYTKPELIQHTVSIGGFRVGFRPANDEEKQRWA